MASNVDQQFPGNTYPVAPEQVPLRPADVQLQTVALHMGHILAPPDIEVPVTDEGQLDGRRLAESPMVVLVDEHTAFMRDTYVPLLTGHYAIVRALRDAKEPMTGGELMRYLIGTGEIGEAVPRVDSIRQQAQDTMVAINTGIGFAAIQAHDTTRSGNPNSFVLDPSVQILEVQAEDDETGQPQPTVEQLYAELLAPSDRMPLIKPSDPLEVAMVSANQLQFSDGSIVNLEGERLFALNALRLHAGLVPLRTIKGHGFRGNDSILGKNLTRLQIQLNAGDTPDILLSAGSYHGRRVGLHPYANFSRQQMSTTLPTSGITRRPRAHAEVEAGEPDPLPETLSGKYNVVVDRYDRRRGERYYTAETLEAKVQQLTGLDGSQVRDMVLLHTLGTALRIPFGPQEGEEKSLIQLREAALTRIQAALDATTFYETGKFLSEVNILALRLGLPPEMQSLSGHQVKLPSGALYPYRAIYKGTRETKDVWGYLSEVFKTDQQTIKGLYEEAEHKLVQQLLKHEEPSPTA
jgi:hypothetical protein